MNDKTSATPTAYQVSQAKVKERINIVTSGDRNKDRFKYFRDT